ncbi:MAG TPA: YchJ family protein [Deltaproteobacteria bacterium]|nr:YchJ family protein [Deltaproteobacteria bacterium]HQI01696.1 YchJ family protein [Deltaproteobacteria bacterium]HQJ10175.1 YchJ family protein [Deltaproteobacteria bacterium]
MSLCPCGSKLEYSECCEPLIKGGKPAQTAEQLMRSRYSAYVKVELDYLLESTHPNQRGDYDLKGTKRWAEKSEWDGIEILSTEKGGPEESEGTVEFIVNYRYKGTRTVHHEMAEFVREDGRWYFNQGKIVPQKQVVRAEEKIGRNEPCPCGSGMKYKKCCGR